MADEINSSELVSEAQTGQEPSGNLNTNPLETPKDAGTTKPKTNFTKIILITLLVLAVVSIPVGYFFYNNYLGNQNEISSAEDQLSDALPSPTSTEKAFTLSLISPQEGDLIVDNQVTVSGQTGADATVLIYTDTSETSIESDALGNFSTNLELESGINSLTVTEVSEDGEEKSLTVNIVNDK